jgi:hypothetical protein
LSASWTPRITLSTSATRTQPKREGVTESFLRED